MPHLKLGESIPPDTAHAVSVSLPTWKANVGYEEGEQWVVDSMTTGYPRFFIHKSIAALADTIAQTFGHQGQQQKAMLFPSRACAQRCVAFIKAHAPSDAQEGLHVMHLVLDSTNPAAAPLKPIRPTISAVLFAPAAFSPAKQYWQHSGDGTSSRRAEFCQGLLAQGLLVPEDSAVPTPPSPSPSPPALRQVPHRGPRRYQRPMSIDDTPTSAPASATTPVSVAEPDESWRFVEERFGRNLDISFVQRAKTAIRRRIAGTMASDAHSPDLDLSRHPLPQAGPSTRGVTGLTEHDIYLYPCGMNAIFHTHRALLSARGSHKSISFGFPYVDTLKILQKFGPGCVFYGRAGEDDLDHLEARLRAGERFLGLFCEFPGNPLLTCPNLQRIRALADEFDFAVVVDETIGTFANINALPFADVVVSSLTKIFSGDCNVMGGSAVLNPASRYYDALKATAARDFEDTYWPEDAIFLERNSRDFASRIDRVNANAAAVAELLVECPLVRIVHYPKYNDSRRNYDACKLPSGGYGGLLSVVFHRKPDAMAFYDNIATAKGPSLGTNFTLTSPYVLLAHYAELDWAASLGVDPDLIRISIGLEETQELVDVFRSALRAAETASQEKDGQ